MHDIFKAVRRRAAPSAGNRFRSWTATRKLGEAPAADTSARSSAPTTPRKPPSGAGGLRSPPKQGLANPPYDLHPLKTRQHQLAARAAALDQRMRALEIGRV